MSISSALLRNDPKCVACEVSDPAHITPGSRGDHVARIQIALNAITNSGLAVDGIYGPATAAAVRGFKNARRILNSHQQTPDDIVGKGTIAALDREMLARERVEFRIDPVSHPVRSAPAKHMNGVRLNFAIPASFADVAATAKILDQASGQPQGVKSVRLLPRQTLKLIVSGVGGYGMLQAINRSPGGSCPEKVCFLYNPSDHSRLNPTPTGFATSGASRQEFGGIVPLLGDTTALSLDAFQPGDAVVEGQNAVGKRYRMLVSVRARSAGPVGRNPLTVLTKGSRFFSASEAEGGEFDPHNLFTGRPVNPRRGGRLINFGGETETPEFEDYQVSLKHSGWRKPQSNNQWIFRPLSNDPEFGIATGSASHITMRGTPAIFFLDEIRRIARPRCLFTYAPGSDDLGPVKAKLSGTVLEEGRTLKGDPLLAMELH